MLTHAIIMIMIIPKTKYFLNFDLYIYFGNPLLLILKVIYFYLNHSKIYF